jgi:hypothetical protein
MIRWFESVPRPGELVLSRDDGGWRHFLDGEPVAYGAKLDVLLSTSPGHTKPRWHRARYESPLNGKDCLVILYHEDGSETQAHDWHHFRWPRDKKGG